MTNKILLASFIDNKFIDDFYFKLDKFFSIKKENTFMFSVGETEQYMITFKLNSTEDLKLEIRGKLRNTIQIHKKGDCFYTINALNKLIEKVFNLQGGNVNYKSYQINWDEYQNKVLLIKEDNLLIQDIKKIIS